MHCAQPVLVFDSGVGGLSIIQALRERLPDQGLVYACDNAAFPYGTKDSQWLTERILAVIAPLVEQVQPALLVIACNTASTLVLDQLRQRYPFPVVGVVPAIKPAAAMTRTGVIGLLATQGTIERPYTQQLIDQFAADCEVIKVGASALVELAEQQLAGQPVAKADLLAVLSPLLAYPRLDTLVLGCTHFPLLQPELDQVARQVGREWQWIDSGAAIARRVLHLLEPLACQSTAVPQSVIPTWMTAPLAPNSRLPVSLARRGLQPDPQLIRPLEAAPLSHSLVAPVPPVSLFSCEG
ncbi:glutamate racemase [Marinospirillum sp.]|uniref:glutamate racemase n=1 Tax=Marinospirillum sp. TaxID=2183934 RepID=UPI003A895802